jgi:signal transduction histidine kinase
MNAAEASPEGESVVLRTKSDPEQGLVILEVEDHGSGIAPENLPRVFDPFFSTKEAGKGVGLGLSVVHGIVEAHGGAISVSSEHGRGSLFTVQLPVHPKGNGIPGGPVNDEPA